MSDRRKVLESFDKTGEEFNQKINSNIEKYRKGDLNIRVVDANGNAVDGARVSIKQKSHEFRFGANLFMLDELETPEKNEAYKKHFAETFNFKPKTQTETTQPQEKKESEKENPQSPTTGIADDFIQNMLDSYFKK